MKKCHSKKSFIFDAKNYSVVIISANEQLIKALQTQLKEFKLHVVADFKQLETLLPAHFDYAIIDDNFKAQNQRVQAYRQLLNQHHAIKLFFIGSQLNETTKCELLDFNVIDFIDNDVYLKHKLSSIERSIEACENTKAMPMLVYSNNDEVIANIKQLLKSFEYEIFIAHCHDEVLKVLQTQSIELMLYDLNNNQDRDFEFLMHQQAYLQDELQCCVVGFTQNFSSKVLRDGLKIGLSDVLHYPFMLEEFLYKVQSNLLNQQKKRRLLCSTQLLEQYKETVDRSSIVSKTDAKGKITYVNEAFCKISGYTKEELIGQSHNIVRHPDMDSAIFSYMWYTIKELKQPWTGQVKNKKKNGSEYWVQTVINPILDAKGEVIEYIGIRTDITDIENTKKYLREQFSITEDKFIEVMNLSKLYESAIDSSNIIIRANLNREITYANDLFYKISGYTPKELIGKPYSYIRRHPDTKDEEIAQMWETIEQGSLWRGKIKNISKTGEPYYSMATVVPIKNSKDEILEYMSIRQDITELVLLHEEIEATQREIVYKMGEIGETRSKETGNHVKRVATYSKLLAQLYGLSNEEADILFTASPMHDIGKVGIPDAVLNKPARLNEDEWKIMKTHAIIGYNILKTSKRKVLQAAAVVARDHHEKWDGTGYPKKRKAEDIHIFGRITAVADVFDALGSDRCYKKAWDDEKIIQLFKEERGKHFEPKLVDLFLENIDSFYAIRKRYED
jgi:PAS domain S-box-containing protein